MLHRILNARLRYTTIQVWKTQHGNKTSEIIQKENEANDWYIILYVCLNCILEYKNNP